MMSAGAAKKLGRVRLGLAGGLAESNRSPADAAISSAVCSYRAREGAGRVYGKTLADAFTAASSVSVTPRLQSCFRGKAGLRSALFLTAPSPARLCYREVTDRTSIARVGT